MLPGLDTPWQLAHLTVPNRVLLAPLAGIGNWCVRLQAKRYGAGMAVSEMVSSFGIHHGNEKTTVEMLRVHPDEHAGGPVALQLFGQDPDVMRSAAEVVGARGTSTSSTSTWAAPSPRSRGRGPARRCSRTPTPPWPSPAPPARAPGCPSP
jgi:hypothetical protein